MNTGTGNPHTSDATSLRNLRRLYLLRNTEIAAIAAGIVIAGILFRLSLPLTPLVVILALITVLNIATRIRLATASRIDDRELFVQMLLDVAGLTAVFAYTGGAGNPFVWFYLLPLMIAATILPRWQTWSMAAITVACYSALFLVKTDAAGMHAYHGGNSDGFAMHVIGMWTGFVMSACFVAIIIVGMASSLRERDRRLAEAREQALRNERLVALGTLAAGTAHELGTPLGTMAILAADLEQEYSGDIALGRKLAILRRQIDRCKDALSSLSAAAGDARAMSGHRVAVGRYLDRLVANWQARHTDAMLKADITRTTPENDIIDEQTLTQSLVNLLNNAAAASPDDIQLHAEWTRDELIVQIMDSGPGLSEEVIGQLGKEPVSTREDGLGIGVFLASATIERLGGRVTIRNRDSGGTCCHITLPLLPKQG